MRPAPLLADDPARRWISRGPGTVTLGRRAAVALSVGFLVLATWSTASVWYLVSQDEMALRLLEGEAAQKRAYEDKLVALRTRLDQVSSQRMVEQQLVETRLQDLLARQAAFEARQGRVESLADRAGVPWPEAGRTEPPREGAAGVSAYAPMVPSGGADPFRPRLRDPATGPIDRRSELDRLHDDLEAVTQNLQSLEATQRRSLEAIVSQAESQSRRFETAVRKVGLVPAAPEVARAGLGGPLVPASPQDPLERLLQNAENSLAELERLQRSVVSLPFGEPIRGEIDLSSGFGYRLDPFTRSPAMHTGLDFKADYGAPARATGAGRVVLAEFSGAYGNMVEIEHAQGVTSRYAHLSSIAVVAGQEVKAGAVLGRVGSTGRSTGPHLHYETRMNGDAVDPQRFLKAGTGLMRVVTASR